MTREQIENILDAFERAVDRKVCAAIDAGACGTAWDYRKRDEAEEAYWTAREAAIASLSDIGAIRHKQR